MSLLPEDNHYLLDGHYYQYDLGWMIEEIKRLTSAINTIYDSEIVHYADPIQWDITSQYTQNTIVVDPKTGDAYISKQAVPYGTDLTNTDYWLPIFNYNDPITELEENIKKIFQLCDYRVSKKTFILIGDSYGVQTEMWSGWIAEFNSLISRPCHASAVGGSGFIGSSSVRTFLQQIVELTPSIADPESITDVFVVGGYNDASTSQSYDRILAEMTKFKTYVNNTFINAMMHVAFPAVDYNSNGMQAKLTIYEGYYKKACDTLGIRYVKNSQYVLLNKSLIYLSSSNPNSGFHPNTEGCKTLAEFFVNYFINGYPSNVIYSDAFSGLTVYSCNGDCNIFPTLGYGVTLPGGTYVFNHWYEAVGLSTVSNLIWGTHNPSTCYMGTCPVIQNDGTFLGYVQFRFLDKKLEINNLYKVSGLVSSGESTLILPNMTIPKFANY